MRHVCLAPHLDDAALSWCGAIHRHTMSGERVQVVTVCAGEVGPDAGLWEFVREHHAQ